MTKNKKLKWICIDGICIFCKSTITTENRPLFPKSESTIKVKTLTVFCTKKNRFIHQLITDCGYYQNIDMKQFLEMLKSENKLKV